MHSTIKTPGYFDNDSKSVYFNNCYYTNAQSSVNKMDEFKATVVEYKPQMIGLTEKWANAGMTDAFFKYHKSIPSQPCKELTECGFNDSAWCSITLNSGDHLLIRVCYSATSSDVNNSEQILHLLNLVDGISASHLLLMGDFNLSDVDFVQYHTDCTKVVFLTDSWRRHRTCFWFSMLLKQQDTERDRSHPSWI